MIFWTYGLDICGNWMWHINSTLWQKIIQILQIMNEFKFKREKHIFVCELMEKQSNFANQNLQYKWQNRCRFWVIHKNDQLPKI